MITNNQIKLIKNLETKSKARRETGLFVIEGVRMFLEAPEDWIEEVYITEGLLDRQDVRDRLSHIPYNTVTDAEMGRISDTMTPQGVLCLMHMPHYELQDILEAKSDSCLYMLLEDIQDPGNLGTILRTGEAAGVDAVIMTRGTVDIYNPKVIRSTMGSIYRVPFIYTDDLPQVIGKLQDRAVTVYAAHLKGQRYYDEQQYRRTAFLIGNEGNGLREETADLADTYIRIPMMGQVESLNAAIASTVLMYEYQRQNRDR